MKFLRIFLLLVFCLQIHAKDRIKLTENEKECLEDFFRLLISENMLGYTLFGAKPVSVADFDPILEKNSISITLEKGWKIWNEIQNAYPSKNYCLKKAVFEKGRVISFLLINKQETLKVLEKHLDIFQNEKFSSAQEILENLCNQDVSFHEICLSQEQIGLLFGYGKSALSFQKQENLASHLKVYTFPPFQGEKILKQLSPLGKLFLEINKKQPSKTSSKKLLQEYNRFIEKRKSFSLEGSIFFLESFLSPVFAYWESHGDYEELQEKYKISRKNLREAYENAPFLETTLKRFYLGGFFPM